MNRFCRYSIVVIMLVVLLAVWAGLSAAAPAGNTAPPKFTSRTLVKTTSLTIAKEQLKSCQFGLIAMESETSLEIFEDRGGDFQYWRSEMPLELSGNQVTMTRPLRWKTTANLVKSAVWQVSLFPFPNNMKNWDTPPGLLASGNVSEVPNADKYAEFKVDFRYFAPEKFRVYKVDQAGAAEMIIPKATAKRSGSVKIARSDVTIVGKQSGLTKTAAPDNTVTARRDNVALAKKSDLSLVAPQDKQFVNLTVARYATLSKTMMQNTIPIRYYIRIVPLGANGAPRGNPSLPVIVTADKIKGMSEDAAKAMAMDGNHPSVRFISYHPLREQAMDWRYHVVVTRDIPGYSGIPGWGAMGQQDPTKNEQKLLYHKGQKLDITPPPPKDKSAWDQFLDDLSSTVDYFENMINSVSNAYALVKQTIVNTLLPEDLRGPFMIGLDIGLVALGIPPSIPNFSELTEMGGDYLIAQVASQAGISEELAQKAVHGVIAAAKEVENGGGNPVNWLKPDPDFLYRPAQITVVLSNNTDKPTDPVTLRVQTKGKNHDPFLSQTLPLPLLAPGETMRVPVFFIAYIPIDAEGSHVDVWKDAYYTVGEMKLQVWTEWQQGGFFPQKHVSVDETIATTQSHYGKGVIPPMPKKGN